MCAASTGLVERPYYKWKSKYGGLDVSEARRLKVLEDENARLKKLLAEAMLDAPVMQRDGTSERCRGSTPRPVASPSPTGSNDQKTLLPTG